MSSTLTVDFAFPGDLDCLFALLAARGQEHVGTFFTQWLAAQRQARYQCGLGHPRQFPEIHAALLSVTPYELFSVPAISELKPLSAVIPNLLSRCLHEITGEAYLAAQRAGTPRPTALEALTQQLRRQAA